MGVEHYKKQLHFTVKYSIGKGGSDVKLLSCIVRSNININYSAKSAFFYFSYAIADT